MSMYRQIWLSLLLTAAVCLAGGLIATTYSAREYLEDQLRIKNADNASALSLSLSPHINDSVEVDLEVAALFDSGHYQLVEVRDQHNKVRSQRKAFTTNYDAPMWFVNAIPITSTPGQALISNGWNQAGSVTIISDTRFAYKTLWESTLAMIASLTVCSLIGGFFGSLIIGRLKKPLNDVVKQAEALTEHHFITTPVSKVPELRKLTSAMNSTVLLLKKMFADEAERLEVVRLEANSDALTKLANRRNFMAQLETSVSMEDTKAGTLILLKIADLAGINQRLGRDTTNALLVAVARVLKQQTADIPNALAARLNGADFGLLLPQTPAHPFADDLLKNILSAASSYLNQDAVAFIGTGQFSYGQQLGNLMARVDAAIVSAEAKGISAVQDAEGEGQNTPNNNEQWLHLIKEAIAQGDVKLGAFPVVDFTRELLHNECPLRLKMNDQWLPAGQFFPIAERLGLSSLLDLTVAKLALEELKNNKLSPELAINLSARSLEDPTFSTQLRDLLMANAKVSQKLWLELPENGVFTHFAAFKEFCTTLKPTNCSIGLEHFGRQFSQIGLLHEVELSYLKIDASFIREIGTNQGNQLFLKGLIGIGHNLNLQIIAEGVTERAELRMLEDLGFDGATGPGVSAKT